MTIEREKGGLDDETAVYSASGGKWRKTKTVIMMVAMMNELSQEREKSIKKKGREKEKKIIVETGSVENRIFDRTSSSLGWWVVFFEICRKKNKK